MAVALRGSDFSRRRRELHGKAAAKIYWEVNV
jgi:hypothetical protein